MSEEMLAKVGAAATEGKTAGIDMAIWVVEDRLEELQERVSGQAIAWRRAVMSDGPSDHGGYEAMMPMSRTLDAILALEDWLKELEALKGGR